MMKNVVRIVIWIMISLILQFAGLFYLDKYYFVSENHFVDKTPVEKPKKVEKVDIIIPQTAKNISVSYDGKYVAYFEGAGLKVVDTTTATAKDVPVEENSKLSYYKWLPDRDRLIMAEKKENVVGFSSYEIKKDMSKNERIDIKDENDKKVYIQLTDNKSEVGDIELSTLTNMIYVKIVHSGKRNSIYSINVMAQMQKVSTVSYLMGKVGIIPHEDKLVYEDLTYKKVYVTGLQNSFSIKGAENTGLVGIDDEDNLYLGQVSKDGITKVVYGSMKENMDKWKTVEFADALEVQDICVSAQGKIYVNDNLKGSVKEINSQKEVTYTGSFVQMYEGGIASISDGKLIKTSLNKN